MKASEFAWFNGAVVPRDNANPSVASNTLHLGIAVFDGLMAYWNDDHWYLHRPAEHLCRFVDGAKRMDLLLPWSAAEIQDGISKLLTTLPARTHYIRPIAYRTGPEVFFKVEEESTSACVFATPAARDRGREYRCQLSPVRRVSHEAIPATWKVSGAYANSYLAERHAQAAGFDTGVMLDCRGRIAEASVANLFFVSGSALVTPRLSGDVFPGITRAMIMELAAAAGIAVLERSVMPSELPGFDAAFLCGTLSEVQPIAEISGIRYKSADNSLVRHVIDGFQAETHR